MKSTKTILRLMLVGLVAGTSLQALAVPATCQSLGIQNNVSANAGCQLGSTANDSVDGGSLQVNSDQMFGFGDWLFAEKGFENDEAIDVGLVIQGDAKSGNWYLNAAIWNIYSDVMLVLKGSNSGGTSPRTYVGYLLQTAQDWGTYLSPFKKNGSRQDISHFTVYVREGVTAVPEPTTLALIGLGLLGLVAMRRR